MQPPQRMRIDKWLWAVRLAKTRSLAAGWCEQGKVKVNDVPAKPARLIRPGDTVGLRKGGFTLQYKTVNLPGQRLPARQVQHYCADITPAETIEALKKQAALVRSYRAPGTGRPSKKERRQLDDFLSW